VADAAAAGIEGFEVEGVHHRRQSGAQAPRDQGVLLIRQHFRRGVNRKEARNKHEPEAIIGLLYQH